MEEPLVTILSKLGIELTGNMLPFVALIPIIVARLKEFPFLKNLQTKGYPAYEGSAIGIGILLALGLSIPNPVVVGLVLGLAGIGGRQVAKKRKEIT